MLALLTFLAFSLTTEGKGKFIKPMNKVSYHLGKKYDGKDVEARYKAFYLESVCQREMGNRTAQYELLSRAMTLCPEAPEAMFDFIEVAGKAGKVNDSLTEVFYEKAINLVPAEKETEGQRLSYMDAYSKYLMRRGNFGKAAMYLEKLTENGPKRKDAFNRLLSCFEWMGLYDNALRCLDKMLQLYGDEGEFLYKKAHILGQKGRYDEELAFLDSLLARMPGQMDFSVLKCEALINKGDTAAGRMLYESMIKEDPQNPAVQQIMLTYYIQTKQERKIHEVLDTLILNDRTPAENRISYLKSIMASKDTLRQLHLDTLFKKLMKVHLENRDVADLYGQYLARKKASGEAYAPVMHKILEVEPEDMTARLYVVQENLEKRDYDSAFDLCREGLHYHEKNLRFYLIGGSVLNQAKRTAEAKAFLEEGLPFVRSNKDVEQVSNYYSAYADVLHTLGEDERSYLYYDTAFIYNPANVIGLNNYAYFLSLREKQLDKAQTMIEKVMKLEPDNPTYIDTYAWVLFVKKDYEGARKQIDAALKYIKGNKEDGSLYDHAGDIYYHLGLHDEALEFWKKADALDCDSKVLKMKIKTKKYISNETQ